MSETIGGAAPNVFSLRWYHRALAVVGCVAIGAGLGAAAEWVSNRSDMSEAAWRTECLGSLGLEESKASEVTLSTSDMPDEIRESCAPELDFGPQEHTHASAVIIDLAGMREARDGFQGGAEDFDLLYPIGAASVLGSIGMALTVSAEQEAKRPAA